MTEAEERDYKASLARMAKLERLMGEMYPDKEFPHGILSPQVGLWLEAKIVLVKKLKELMEAGKTEEVLEEVKMILKREELWKLWNQCYNQNNS